MARRRTRFSEPPRPFEGWRRGDGGGFGDAGSHLRLVDMAYHGRLSDEELDLLRLRAEGRRVTQLVGVTVEQAWVITKQLDLRRGASDPSSNLGKTTSPRRAT